ncbi:DUF1566 domain-containing protein [Crenothrix polyspora]|uniref:Lcl C-terminal domain-containing protein n=1 Tax=Crenothrix polyspora TaxID=360316 RepID=A0A1R4H9K0_9GAMM|nr:DUF1566 domain-containing protein [Crenothrix polyspora]SJM92903.1 conserved hypothetical protein [Crenothrix polyspora]
MIIFFNPNSIGYLCAGLLIAALFISPAISTAAVKPAPKPVYKIKLNDTGIDTCSDLSESNLPCPQKAYPGQDAQFGRDKTANKNSDGHAGFSFTKMSSTGKALAANALVWSCVKDNVTGLLWEIKTNDGGLHDKDWTYSWYEPNKKINGGNAGSQNAGLCGTKTGCNTYAYVKAVNKVGWCGFKDWRLPTVEELFNLTSLDRDNPAVDTDYFPEDHFSFWSSTTESSDITGNKATSAWYVNFNTSFSHVSYYNKMIGSDSKSNEYIRVRLVRGGQ